VILVDTGAIYALADRHDGHHKEAAAFFQKTQGQEILAIPVPVLTEAALLVEARLGMRPVRALWDDLLDGMFELLPLSVETLELARKIDRRYADANLGLVDAVCLALCEEHQIAAVFTYDRRDFGLYRPTFAASLTLVP